jgi:hypothetical protein
MSMLRLSCVPTGDAAAMATDCLVVRDGYFGGTSMAGSCAFWAAHLVFGREACMYQINKVAEWRWLDELVERGCCGKEEAPN